MEIISQGLTKENAVNIETDLYHKHKDTIVNASKPGIRKEYDREFLLQFVEYSEDSETFLVHKGTLNKAGYISKNGQGWLKIKGYRFLISRVVASIFRLLEKDKIVDHIDGDTTNNALNNLRCIPQSENTRNSKMRKDNSSGFTGVGYEESSNRWTSRWRDLNGIERRKSFAISKYTSSDEARDAAIQFRIMKLKELNESGQNYSERHGT